MFDANREAAEPVLGQPLPIKPTVAAPGVYPVDALSPKLKRAALAIVDKVQLPVEIAACSVLAAASLAVQAYVDVVMPTGEQVPTSLYFASSASSGARKSSNDKIALSGVRRCEAEMRRDHISSAASHANSHAAWTAARKKAMTGKADKDAIEHALNEIGREPLAPPTPLLLVDEPTMPALQKLFAEAMPSLGLFSDEGGTLLGGFAMSEENRTQTGGVLSKLWDGAPIKRQRASEQVMFLPGRRLALHIMVQPRIARKLFGDPDLKEQGLLSRILICEPTSMMGARFWKDPGQDSDLDLEKYESRVFSLLGGQMPMDPETRELRPIPIFLSPEARELFIAFHDAVERELRPGGTFEDIKGFAGKLPEHAVRIGAVMAFFENRELNLIDRTTAPLSGQALAAGIKIASFHADEALRLFGGTNSDDDTENAAAIITWIREHKLEQVGARILTRHGPGRPLSGPALKRAIGIMVDLGHLSAIAGGAQCSFAGKTAFQREAYTVIPDDGA